MMNKTTTVLLCLCLMSNGLFAACSKKPADDSQNQAVQPEENKDQAQNNGQDAAVPENPTDAKPAEAKTDTDESEARNDAPAKRSHQRHDYKILPPKTSGIAQNPILKEIPGDSFFILASSGNFNLQREDVGDFFKHISTLMLHHTQNIPEDSPFTKATKAFGHAIFKTFSPEKLTSLGIAGETSPQFAFYFVRQTPVLRIAMSNAEKFRGIIESYWEQNNVETHRADNVSSHWILVPLEENSSTELALRWEQDRLTITMISSMEHAGFLLPDIMTLPDEEHSAYEKLSSLNTDDNAAAVGIFDDNAMLNQFASLQEQYKKFAGQSHNPVNNTCLKDFRRIADTVPRVIIQMFVVTGGTSAGIDLKLSMDVTKSDWIKELLTWEPQSVSHPTQAEMPVAQFYAALPMKTLFKGIKTIHESVQKEHFACPELEFLNDIEIPEEAQKYAGQLEHDQFIGYTAYEMDSPHIKSYAATWDAENAASLAAMLGLVESDSLTEMLAAAQNPDQDAENHDADAQKKAPESQVIADAKLTLNKDLQDLFESPNYQIQTNRVTITSDKGMIEALAAKPLKPAKSLLHLSASERLTSLFELADNDDARDYLISIDLETTDKTIDVVLRYAIE